VHVNRLKLYKERLPIEEPRIPNDNNFNPEKEKVIDKSKVKKEKEAELILEEVEVQDITGYRIKRGKLEYLTTYKDSTTSWQPEENFIKEDGTTTTAILEYYEGIKSVHKPQLHAQIEKF